MQLYLACAQFLHFWQMLYMSFTGVAERYKNLWKYIECSFDRIEVYIYYLHFTSRYWALLSPSPSWLDATHVYKPAWWRLTFWSTKVWLPIMMPLDLFSIKNFPCKKSVILITTGSWSWIKKVLERNKNRTNPKLFV